LTTAIKDRNFVEAKVFLLHGGKFCFVTVESFVLFSILGLDSRLTHNNARLSYNSKIKIIFEIAWTLFEIILFIHIYPLKKAPGQSQKHFMKIIFILELYESLALLCVNLLSNPRIENRTKLSTVTKQNFPPCRRNTFASTKFLSLIAVVKLKLPALLHIAATYLLICFTYVTSAAWCCMLLQLTYLFVSLLWHPGMQQRNYMQHWGLFSPSPALLPDTCNT
jgi:hypothetical protein